MNAWCVEVNECAAMATRMGADWWITYRDRYEPIGRIEVITASIAGDRVRVACDDEPQARWLSAHMVEFGGLPKSAVKTVRIRSVAVA